MQREAVARLALKPDDLYHRASERAAAEGKSISEVVRDLLAAYAKRREVAAPRRRRSN